MLEGSPSLPPYVGLRPRPHGDYLFGIERPTDIWSELVNLAAEEWDLVGGYEEASRFDPDFSLAARYENQAALVAVTVRRKDNYELVGYFIGTLSKSLIEKGSIILNEIALYLKRGSGRKRRFKAFLEYVEEAAESFGCNSVLLAHNPNTRSVGRLYQTHGYAPLSCSYIKRLEHDKS